MDTSGIQIVSEVDTQHSRTKQRERRGRRAHAAFIYRKND